MPDGDSSSTMSSQAQIPMGIPPPAIFPRVVMSGLTPKYSWAPPMASLKPVMTSSKITGRPRRWRSPVAAQDSLPGAGSTGVADDRFQYHCRHFIFVFPDRLEDGIGIVVLDDRTVLYACLFGTRGIRHGMRRGAVATLTSTASCEPWKAPSTLMIRRPVYPRANRMACTSSPPFRS